MENNKADIMFKEGFSARREFVFNLRMNQSVLNDLGTDRERYGQSLRGGKEPGHTVSERKSM